MIATPTTLAPTLAHRYELLAIAASHFMEFVETELAIQAKVSSLDPKALVEAREAQAAEDQSRLLTMYDTVAHIEVKGVLTNRDSFWNQFFGMVSYNEIREAMIGALENGASSILFSIDSPGGSVSGLADVSNFMSNLPVKTVTHTSSKMASAGYFFGSQADYVYADNFAEVGSIGVILKFYDRSKLLADNGIKPIRFRSGELKAVGDGDFALTAKETAYLKGMVTTFAGKFYDIVSDATGMPIATMEKLGILSGKTFIGQESVDVNLVDELKTFDQAMMKAFALAKKVDEKKPNPFR